MRVQKSRTPARGRPTEEGSVHTLSWRAKSEDVLDRLAGLRATWIADAVWRPAWAKFVAEVGRLTSHWPNVLGLRVGGTIDPEEARVLAWSEEPRVGAGPHPAPMLRPLFQALAASTSPDEIDRLLKPPAPLPLPKAPKTSAEARSQYLEIRALYTRERIAIRHGHRRRAELAEAIAAAQARFRSVWRTVWLAMADGVAGDPMKARALATRLHRESLETLATLFGARPAVETLLDAAEPMPKPKRPRPKKKAAKHGRSKR